MTSAILRAPSLLVCSPLTPPKGNPTVSKPPASSHLHRAADGLPGKSSSWKQVYTAMKEIHTSLLNILTSLILNLWTWNDHHGTPLRQIKSMKTARWKTKIIHLRGNGDNVENRRKLQKDLGCILRESPKKFAFIN